MTNRAFDKIKAGLEEAIDIARRRFGPGFDKSCANPETIECARWRCQHANECQHAEIEKAFDISRHQ